MQTFRIALVITMLAGCAQEISAGGAGVALGASPVTPGSAAGPATPPKPDSPPAVPAVPPPPRRESGCFRPVDITSSINAGSISGSTLGATDTQTSPCGASASPERIFSIRPATSGYVTASTAHPGTDYDTVLSVRTSCTDASTTLACNDDCVGLASCVTWFATAGQTYFLIVEGYASSAGNFELRLTQTPAGPSECAVAPIDATAAIGGAPIAGSTVGMANDGGSFCGGAGSPEVVYAVTAPGNGVLSASTAHPGTDYDTMLSARTRCNDPGSEIACNDDCVGLASCISFPVIGGQTYYIRVEGFAASAGDYELSLSFTASGGGGSDGRRGATRAIPPEPATPGSRSGPAAPPPFRLPDLIVDQEMLSSSTFVEHRFFAPGDCTIAEGCTGSEGERRLLRFTTRIHNIGEADYFLGDPSGPAFSYDACHGHSHYDSYARYQLRDGSGAVVRSGGKSGFCVLDLDCPPGVMPQYHCGYQGITAGCADIYDAALDCQWVDITGLATGCYTLEVEANWQRTPSESDFANNVASTTVCITDAPSCGDGVCSEGERCTFCPEDCGPCGACTHDECTEGEPLSPACSPCAEQICAFDPYCCEVFWDGLCTGAVQDRCGFHCEGIEPPPPPPEGEPSPL